ncbi:MAG: 1,4-dihydroxy-6-naphthoate synthase [Gemmatimonadetes bacterium]|nr:1,4-dihydroxy-6-naphthoate synthase [Gemmatimonadota bacterium]
MTALSLGYSPCPNDTFIFCALVQGRIPNAPKCREVLEDIETLNTLALERKLDLTKISFHALGHLRDHYVLLRAGGALGRGCGPLVVSREPLRPEQLKDKKIALPGRLTTAALLMRLFDPSLDQLVYLPFDQIMPACRRGDVDAGVIIHESRFTYAEYGLSQVIDLGAWWEEEAGHPIPLGGILARRDLGGDIHERLNRSIRSSIEFAYAHPDEVKPYIRRHSQEMDEKVMQQHIDLYVNQYSLQYGDDGEAAIRDLYDRAERAGIVPSSKYSLFE